jgi:uncharacterized alkaline shock family protein YloU
VTDNSMIATEVLARYAADAAAEVPGIRGLAGRRGVRISDEAVELHLVVEWGASIPAVGAAVQERVAAYLSRMADIRPRAVNVVVDEIVGP